MPSLINLKLQDGSALVQPVESIIVESVFTTLYLSNMNYICEGAQYSDISLEREIKFVATDSQEPDLNPELFIYNYRPSRTPRKRNNRYIFLIPATLIFLAIFGKKYSIKLVCNIEINSSRGFN